MAGTDPNELIQNDWFAKQRRNADLQFGLGWNQNEFDRKVAQGDPKSGLLGQNYWSRQDLMKQLLQQRKGFQTPYAQRGIMHSGIYQQNLAEMAKSQAEMLSRQRQGFADQATGFQMGGDQLKLIRQRALDDLASTQDAYRKARAASLSDWRGTAN